MIATIFLCQKTIFAFGKKTDETVWYTDETKKKRHADGLGKWWNDVNVQPLSEVGVGQQSKLNNQDWSKGEAGFDSVPLFGRYPISQIQTNSELGSEFGLLYSLGDASNDVTLQLRSASPNARYTPLVWYFNSNI